MNEMTHERCSELLADHVHGRLGAEDERAVSAHLDTCRECTAEHGALVALSGPGPEPLTDLERARMRRVVLDEAVPIPDEVASVAPSRDRRARVFPLLGAAALIVIAAVFAYGGLGGLGGSDEDGGAMDAAESGGEGGDDSGASMEEQTTSSQAEVLDGAEGGGAAGRGTAAPAPQFKASLGPVDSKKLNNLGRHGLPLVVFSRSYSVADVPALREDLVEQLAEQAPGARADQIRECSGTITSEFATALPVYSAIGTFADGPDREVLILAFVWTDESDGPLDQSMVWAWPLGSCDSIAHYSKNVIQPKG